MHLPEQAKLLRVHILETTKHKGKPVYELIVMKAKELGLAGATVLRGIMGFDLGSKIHSSKMLELSQDLPLVVEIVETQDKINKLMPFLDEIFEGTPHPGLVTIEDIQVIKYKPTQN
ncbi:MAG TPA: hypothetical protein DD381_07845 [Lentisphaeria bacterium]|nr:MAG: hypothetical protein A2X47_04410 [Lentisphaerae bacterium GWF2_38_69]HBM16234.1 hypothetical protein [Lentisphaeria bacterium]